jgi:hypothetical protein
VCYYSIIIAMLMPINVSDTRAVSYIRILVKPSESRTRCTRRCRLCCIIHTFLETIRNDSRIIIIGRDVSNPWWCDTHTSVWVDEVCNRIWWLYRIWSVYADTTSAWTSFNNNIWSEYTAVRLRAQVVVPVSPKNWRFADEKKKCQRIHPAGRRPYILLSLYRL